MQVVRHTVFGVGEVIAKEPTANGSKITVLFENGQEKIFSIPHSFMLGLMTVEGDLKDEVDKAIAEHKALQRKRDEELRAEAISRRSVAHGARHGVAEYHISASCAAILTDYETYLINAGYATETPSGNPSTVYSYIRAIEKHVLDSEHVTWTTLKDNIDSIVEKYDIGGDKEDVGAIGNCTVINALRRFKDFVNP